MRNELLEDALATLRQAGIKPQMVRNRHIKLSWIDQQGRRRCLVVALSPSDHRARRQSRAVLRRLLAP
jgi:hypothetical protein